MMKKRKKPAAVGRKGGLLAGRSPAQIICVSFLLVIALGAVLLTLPISSRSGRLGFIDALFTATSATCVTGLVVRDTWTQFSPFGQAVVLLLIQIGGLGLVTLTSFFSLAARRRMGFRDLRLLGESVSADGYAQATQVLKIVIRLAATFEALGVVLLLAALAVLFRLSLDMREFLSCAAAGVSASGLGALLTSAVLLCSGYAGWRDPAEPDAAAFRMWFAGFPRGLLMAGVLLLAAGAAVLLRTQRAAEPVREESAAQAADAEPVREEPAPQEKQPSVRAAGAPIVKQPPARVWAHARAIGPARSVRTDRAAHIPQRKI